MGVTTDQLRKITLLSGLVFCLTAGGAWSSTLRVQLADGSVAGIDEDHELFLESQPGPGEGLLAFSRRYCGDTDTAARAISQANAGTRQLRAGVRYRIPFSILIDPYRLRVARALFEDDRAVGPGWEHRVRSFGDVQRESLWRISEWFTGRGENFSAIREANNLADDHVVPGQIVLIPAQLLLPAFRSGLPPSSPYHLEYGEDGRGDYVLYRLKAGEALYSSVIVRFTGRVFAEDVNALADEVAERSGIEDVTDIPVDFGVKVPLEFLLPEYLPSGHPRRNEYEEGLLASARFSNQVRTSSLKGVTLILDAGHGGNDVGASLSGVWESLYVYDIMVRTKQLLESTTAAKVVATTMEGSTHLVADRDQLPYTKKHRVLTTPNYTIEDSRVGVHLRWYLSNSVFRQAVKQGGDAEKVVFISIHADSLHPSLRGAMAYIPGAKYRGGTYGKGGTVYASRREYNERPQVTFAKHDLVKSEGLSRDLAQNVIQAFRREDLEVHPYKPIREKVIRSQRSWVPAVLRYNEVPAEMLLEVCNLANSEDRRLIQTRAFRQQVAETIVRGILSYYDGTEADAAIQVAATGG
ncbi:MAG: N-acetylmuramoyl-L-alanine amidase [Thermoanaerobaculia bacterium]